MCQKGDVKTVDAVVKMGLCTGCGTCVSMCPSRAITMTTNRDLGIFLPRIDSSKCGGCSACLKVCPGFAVNFKELSRKVSPRQNAGRKSNLLGNYLNCYVGYSTDYDLRFNSSSGGIVTQLLVFALEEGLIEGALVTRMRKDQPLKPESFIARSFEELVDASKSKYCPVSANVALSEILEHEGKYAVVGLPCHVHGLRKAQALNKRLRDRVVLSIGLFCSHNDSFFSTEYLLNRFNINPSDVKSISYRGKGWPGILRIEQKSGNVTECPFQDWIRVHEYCFFTPDRCLVCCDHVAELADLATGDAWLPEFSEDHLGTSIFISRNERSERILKLASSKGRLAIRKISSSEVVKSQGNVRFKKNCYVVRSFLFRLCRKSTPKYAADFPKPGLVELPRSAIIFLNRKLASKRYFYQNLEHIISLQIGLKKLYTTSTLNDFV